MGGGGHRLTVEDFRMLVVFAHSATGSIVGLGGGAAPPRDWESFSALVNTLAGGSSLAPPGDNDDEYDDDDEDDDDDDEYDA